MGEPNEIADIYKRTNKALFMYLVIEYPWHLVLL